MLSGILARRARVLGLHGHDQRRPGSEAQPDRSYPGRIGTLCLPARRYYTSGRPAFPRPHLADMVSTLVDQMLAPHPLEWPAIRWALHQPPSMVRMMREKYPASL
jgi:hypothetical protein